jgi:transposase
LRIGESREGYEQLRQVLQKLLLAQPDAHFNVRIDAAGQYAANLERFLRELPMPMTISLGEPKRNRDYHRAMFPKRKADATESQAMARFAVVEQPPESSSVPEPFLILREIAGRLRGHVKDVTRAKNRLHNLLARVFPELDPLIPEIGAQYVLQLLEKYPTPQRIARAPLSSLTKIPYLTEIKAGSIQAAARDSIGSLQGEAAEGLVRAAVEDLRHHQKAQKSLEHLLVECFQALPESGYCQVATIPGIGPTTAAVLVAKIVSIDRFATPGRLVGYFGVFPEEDASGVDASGAPRPSRGKHMSRKGSDLVRCYLWNAAKAARRSNPAVRALYRRLRANGTRGDVALGHCMRKLLHLVFAVWATDQPFDENHYPWEQGRNSVDPPTPTSVSTPNEKAAGHKREIIPTQKVVTAAKSSVVTQQTVNKKGHATSSGTVDYAWLRESITIQQVLEHFGCWQTLRNAGQERRGPCPFHGSSRPTSRSFAVNPAKNVYHCHNPACQRAGNIIDFWAAKTGLPLYQAALDLAQTFQIPTTRQQRRGARKPNAN